VEYIKIIELMGECQRRLANASRSLFKLAEDKAQSEYEYRSALAQEILKLKTEGHSVTLIPDIARGNTAATKLKRDLADSMFTAGRESVSALQSEARILMAMMDKQSDIGS
jgi:hypothetical protein